MIINPELRRNVWLDFTSHRVIFTPLILGFIIYLFSLINHETGAEVAYWIGCYFLFLWGSHSASNCVLEEVNNNTWDFQRQSAISPWGMTIGKWLGSTLFSWYGVLICFLFYIILQSSAPIEQHAIGRKLLTLCIGGLFTQALALLLSIQILPLLRYQTAHKTFSTYFAAGFIGVFMTVYCHAAQKFHFMFQWHYFQFDFANFFLVSFAIFLGWTVIGLYRTFSKELQYQNIPWVWLLFNAYCIIYFSGFGTFFKDNAYLKQLKNAPDLSLLLESTPLYIAFVVSVLLCYSALFTDSLNSLRYRRVFTRIFEGNIIETLQQIPWWVISFVLMILVGVLSTIMQSDFKAQLKDLSVPIFILTTLLFVARDILLAHYFYLSNNPKRAQAAVLLYLAILWLALPAFIGLLNADYLFPAIVPSWGENTALALVSVLAQIGLFGFLVVQRWESIWRPEEPTKIITIGKTPSQSS